MENEILENHKRYSERVDLYKRFGYDLEQERDFILDKSLPFSSQILEIGTGKGHFALRLAKRGYSFISVDLSKEEQNIALLNFLYYGVEKQITLRIGDAQHLNFPDKSFDTIFCINTFHHLENPLPILDEMMRLMRIKGKTILSDFNVKGFEIIDKCHALEGRKHNFFKHSLDDARNYFIKNHFNVRDFQSKTQRVLIAENIRG